MLTSEATILGHRITENLGIVEGIAEGSFNALQVGGIGFSKGGGLEQLVETAKSQLAQSAADKGADAVVGFRYEIMGRDLEKSVLAYGTAVRCQKKAEEPRENAM